MYLRDLIKIGGIFSPISGVEEYVDNDNSVISKIEKGSKNTLVVYLIKKRGNLTGRAHIRSKDARSDILEKILFSQKISGKTLNELKDFRVEDLL